MTPFQRHKEEWSDCTQCPLHCTRKRVVHLRGKLPALVLFVGEAPGPSEDVLGRPFCGPAGQLLDDMLSDAGFDEVSHALTNLVGCIPLDDERKKFGEPGEESIKACQDRLKQIVLMAKPVRVVAVGALAAKQLKKRAREYGIMGLPITDILHPAFILRSPDVGQSLLVRKTVATLAGVAAEVVK